MNSQIEKRNNLLRHMPGVIFGISACALLYQRENLKTELNELSNSPKIEYLDINKDSISDIVVNDRKNNDSYVMLSSKDGSFEKIPFTSLINNKDISVAHILKSKKDNLSYKLYETVKDNHSSFEAGDKSYPNFPDYEIKLKK